MYKNSKDLHVLDLEIKDADNKFLFVRLKEQTVT